MCCARLASFRFQLQFTSKCCFILRAQNRAETNAEQVLTLNHASHSRGVFSAYYPHANATRLAEWRHQPLGAHVRQSMGWLARVNLNVGAIGHNRKGPGGCPFWTPLWTWVPAWIGHCEACMFLNGYAATIPRQWFFLHSLCDVYFQLYLFLCFTVRINATIFWLKQIFIFKRMKKSLSDSIYIYIIYI